MALQPYDLVANAAVDLDGAGHVLQTDALLTYVGRESGKVDVYLTEHVAATATLTGSEDAATESAEDKASAERIAQLEAELAAAKGETPGPPPLPPVPEPAPAPAPAPAPPTPPQAA